MRTFIAIELTDLVKRLIEQAQIPLRSCGADVTWVKPSNIHVTLKFLGEVPPDKVREVFDATREALAGHPRFSMTLEGMGVFPNLDRPRVIWIGAKQGAVELTEMAEQLEGALEQIGFAREGRHFTPHFTIGRVRSPRNLRPVLDLVRTSTFASPKIPVESVVVMKSDLQPAGAVYTPQHRVGLG